MMHEIHDMQWLVKVFEHLRIVENVDVHTYIHVSHVLQNKIF